MQGHSFHSVVGVELSSLYVARIVLRLCVLDYHYTSHSLTTDSSVTVLLELRGVTILHSDSRIAIFILYLERLVHSNTWYRSFCGSSPV